MRLLIVEDEPRIAEYLARGLEEQGYAVDIARTGGEAIAWVEVVPFDLIVLDILLPEMDGLEVCRELRRREVRTPILMLTARGEVGDRVQGLDAGADDYLVKPFSLNELAARLRALARRDPDASRSPTLTYRDLRMDTATRRVVRGEAAIRLTPREYALLECLLRAPEQVLSRARIAEQVWNYDDAGSSNVVDVHMRNLRRKVDGPFDEKLIRTVRGVGYCLSTQGGDDDP